jgi:hypothetical protein
MKILGLHVSLLTTYGARYWAFKNARSMDGLPAMQIARQTAKEESIAPMPKMVGPLAPRHYERGRRFGAHHLILVAVLSALLTSFALLVGVQEFRPWIVSRLSGSFREVLV